jgi:threonine aldolase
MNVVFMHEEQFASDNYAGMCPEVFAMLAKANQGFAPAYGEDEWTKSACDHLREVFEHPSCEIFFVFNGTAANSLALASLCQSYHSVICHEGAHVETDECGAPEFFSNGSKLLLATGEGGKLTPKSVREWATKRVDVHYPKPKVLSLTQSTECGTVYNVAELQALAAAAKAHRLRIHMDGARFANALASTALSPAELSWKSGVDVLCLGGTKAGMALGEAVLFFDSELAEDFAYRCKQSGQLCSKMRYIAAPWLAMLDADTWIRYAKHANSLARLLAELIADIPSLSILYPVEANAVFVAMPTRLEHELRIRGWHFYTFIGGASRFMFSWNSTEKRVQDLVWNIKDIVRNGVE